MDLVKNTHRLIPLKKRSIDEQISRHEMHVSTVHHEYAQIFQTEKQNAPRN